MAVYAVGDIQGHLYPLTRLLEIVRFDPARDQLWIAGDMVNRGPDSLEVLRFIRGLGDAAIPVLGNHDLHLLSVAAGVQELKPGDTISDVLHAPDLEQLVAWLRGLPFVHFDPSLKTMLVHAGIYFKWGRKRVHSLNQELMATLQGEDCREFLRNFKGKKPRKWKKDLEGMKRYRFLANVFTRMRFCTIKGKLDFHHKGPPGSQPPELIPWFRHPGRKCRKWRIVFGHWSTLGYLREANVISLDSGCLWGKTLTLVQLDCAEERIWQFGCS